MKEAIVYVEQAVFDQKPLFSIIVPSWNNLPFLALCIRGIRQNSTYQHQIIVHINDGSDGTLAWVQQQGLDYTHSAQNVGICMACNAAYSLSKADYIVYMNDDMYACPAWDARMYEAIEAFGRKDFYFSSTQIDRFPSDWGVISQGHDYGDSPDNFREQALCNEYQTLAIPDWQGASIPPSVMHRYYWDLIGGFSIELSPGIYSDPDMSRKLWTAGVRNFKGVGNSLVYHFVSKSLHKVAHNPGRKQFLRKWQLSARNFYDNYIHFYTGQKDYSYKGIIDAPEMTFKQKIQHWMDRIKAKL